MEHAIKTTLHRSCDRIVVECGDFYQSYAVDTTKWEKTLAAQERIHADAARQVLGWDFTGTLISRPLTPPRFELKSIKNVWVHIVVEK